MAAFEISATTTLRSASTHQINVPEQNRVNFFERQGGVR